MGASKCLWHADCHHLLFVPRRSAGTGARMKRLLGLAVLTAGLAVPAHAQAPRAMAASMAPSPMSSGSGGGGGGFGGGSSSGGGKLTSYPVARFNVTSVSGSQQDYIPSTFVSYDEAVAAGRAILNAPPKSLDEVARETSTNRRETAKLALVQDANGNAVIQPR